MNAVLLYSDTRNPSGVPGGWPCEVVPNAQSIPADGRPWRIMTDEMLEAQKAAHQAAYDAWLEAYVAGQERVRELPESVTARQIRLWLLGRGLLDTVEALIEQMPPDQRRAAQIEWEFATEYRLDHPLLTALAACIGLTGRDLEDAFSEAASL